MSSSLLEKAAALTNRVFGAFKHSDFTYKEMPFLWSIYSVIHYRYSLPLTLGASHSELLKSLKRERLRDLYKILTLDLLRLAITLISLVWLLLTKGKKVAIWSGDFYSEETKGDFRLGDLFGALQEEGIQYVEFIRDSEFGAKRMISNLFRRGRPVIYYLPIIRLCRLLSRPVKIKFSHELSKEQASICQAAAYQVTNKYQVNILRFLFRLLNVKALIAWEFMERQASLIYAANLEGIDAIGFMHGAGMNSYMPHEFMSCMVEKPDKFGIDIMGVWSPWWKSYYQENTVFYNNYEIISPLKEKRDFRKNLSRYSDTVKNGKLLWVCEPLVSPSELIQFIDVAEQLYDVVFKIRKGAKNSFYEELLALRPHLASNQTMDYDMFDAISECSVVVGSHSTAVLDASLINTPFLLVNTKKWGNYFKLPTNFFSISPQDFESKLKRMPEQDLESSKLQWFGNARISGVDFLVNRIKNITSVNSKML